jgi:hypothetical protein
MALNVSFTLYVLILSFSTPLSAQWSKTIYQTLALPDTLTRFSISAKGSVDTTFWIGSEILIETKVTLSGIKESIFHYLIKSDRYHWMLSAEKSGEHRVVQGSMTGLKGMAEQVHIKIYVPEYFEPSGQGYFMIPGLRE